MEASPMKHSLCGQCYLQGFCRRLTSRAVVDCELTPTFLRNVRAHMRAKNLKPSRWKAYLTDAYQDYPGQIVDGSGQEVELDTGVYDGRNIKTWFRDMCRELPADVRPRIRRETRKRFKVTASILRAVDPVAAIVWGGEIANDEGWPLPPSPVRSEAECSYRHFTVMSWGGE
jgi:hypothetical protein